ncbi:MAG: TRAP transporter substrate-binding protein [Clostridiales Family XIII bacterium]|jgi:TRAP-type C4-dicarboxylate transport system substrate-binding protein|nr:TRAP transporter substrate-binding protein [Clostridiales Family XIII bacterium]
MKRRIFVILAAAVAFSVMLAACGGGITAPSETPEETAAETAEPDAGQAPEQTAQAPEFEFSLQNHDAPNGATSRSLDVWAEAVGEASGGRIKITNFHGGSLGGPQDTYGMVKDGVADIGWGLASFYPGMFPATEVIALPFMGIKSAKQGGYALWELYDTTDFLKSEWTDVKVILIHTNCDAPLLTRTKIEKVEDLRGMNLRIIGGPPTEWAKLVGANPMNILLGEIYTSMEKGVISGITSTGWDVVNSFRFYEQGPYVLDYAIHVNACFLIMNKASYDSLPDDLKAVMDEMGGNGAIEVMGDIRDNEKVDVRQKILDAGGEIYELQPAEQARVEAFGEQAREIWMKSMNDQGIEADALVAKTLELVEKHKDKAPN